MRKIVQCSIFLAAALLLTACTHAGGASSVRWRAVDVATGQVEDIAELQQLQRDFPNSGSVRLRLLNAALEAGELDLAYAQVAELSQRGYRFSSGAEAQLLAMFEGDQAGVLTRLFGNRPERVLASELVTEVPVEAKLVEGIAFSPDLEALMVTAAVSRNVWTFRNGEWRGGSTEGPANISGIAYDSAGGRWLASADLGMMGQKDGFKGLIELALSPVRSNRYPAPEGVNLSDIAIGDEDTVYASDPIGGGVYVLGPDREVIETLVEPGMFRSPQGLAESADGRWLYVSDYRYGLAAISLETGAVHRMTTQLPILLDGIDALQRYQGELVAVQNGSRPMQIVALELGRDGLSITARRVLERDHPDWTEPLGAVLREGRLFYIANGQWGSFGEGGEVADDAELVPTIIRSLPLDPPPMAETP